VESCSHCAAELEARTRLRARLQAAVRAAPVPRELEAKVQRAVRTQRTRPYIGLYAMAAAAVVIIGVLFVNLMRTRGSSENAVLRRASATLGAVLNVGFRDHLHCAVLRKYSRQPETAGQMTTQLGPEFAGLEPALKAKLPAEFRILQAHRCEAGGRQYIHFILSGETSLLSLVLTRKRAGESLNGALRQAGVDQYQVVGFETPNYLAYLVSDLPPERNLQLAASLAPTVREFLATRG
jgi:hypothetical protein